MSTRFAALVLAAGRSERFGAGGNKLLAPFGGAALVTRPVDAALAAGLDPVVVVVGYEAERVRHALSGRPLHFAHADDHAEGMGASLRCGARTLARLTTPPDAVLVITGDMPLLRREHIAPLCEAFVRAGDGAICVPVHAGRRGHPVLFAAAHLPALTRLAGDRGARSVLEARADQVVEVAIADAAIHRDVDTQTELREAASAYTTSRSK